MAADNHKDQFGALADLQTRDGAVRYARLNRLGELGIGDVSRLPYSRKVLLESALRNLDGFVFMEDHVRALADPKAAAGDVEVPFLPGRVVLQDFTGVPVMVDLAAMRAAMARQGGDPKKINPLVPVDLVIDHSVQVDAFGSNDALGINADLEFVRNRERYEFLRWGQTAFQNVRVVPPATGIVHQVNLEYLATVVMTRREDIGVGVEKRFPTRRPLVYPDSLVGTDSHTTMINGLGVLGWGVGGIEAEAVMLGQPIYMLIPEVVGVKLTGVLSEGATATDMVLRVTEMLRAHGVVNKFVEFFGPALARMSVADRATIANMAPEYGATTGFFPIDEQTIRYMRLTGRDETLVDLVERYARAQGLWRDDAADIQYNEVLELDISTVEPSLAGPRRPQDRVALSQVKPQWRKELRDVFKKPVPSESIRADTWAGEGGAVKTQVSGGVVVSDPDLDGVSVQYKGREFVLRNGSVVISAITSCTNTSNPSVMIGAGLLARNAAALGLTAKPWVKTSLAPGSKVVTEYLKAAGLLSDLEALGYNVVGYGCTTCIGNSGPLPEEISAGIKEGDLIAVSVLSGNRNFEGRVSPDCRANYLASPPLVVAYGIAGTVDIDLTLEPIGHDKNGEPIYLREIWPSQDEVNRTMERCIHREQFLEQYGNVFEGPPQWRRLRTATGDLYSWDEQSTYIQEPPFLLDMPPAPQPIAAIHNARCLVKVGDSVTTDHISPAGSIPAKSPAGQYLIQHGVTPDMFNSYGARRGNDRVMTRGTYANIRVKNHLAPGTEGGFTTDFLDGKVKTIFEASLHYRQERVPLVVLAGKDYGMGSSRDWAAKGVQLLGVRAAIAESFERIHRSNLVGMGVLPLTFRPGETAAGLGLDGTEVFDIQADDRLKPRQDVSVTARKPDGRRISFTTICRIDTPVEIEYYRHGGILPFVLRQLQRAAGAA